VVASILRHIGLNPVANRAPSVLLGMLVVAMVWVIGNRMRGPGLGLFAAILTASDGWIFTLSRVAMTDIYLISMVVAAYAVLYVWWTATSHRNAWMLLLGATCGMAVSMKWSAVPPLLGLVPLVVSRFVVDWRRSPGTRARTQIDAAIAVVSLTVVPAWIYVTSFLPFFAAGNSLTELVGMHRAILEYNRTFPVTARDGTRWYSWPLDRGFTWFVTRSDDHVTCWYSLPSGNWFVWLPFLPTMAYAVARFVRRPQFERAFVVVAGMAMWLPYGLVRRVEYTRYFALAIPFSALAVSMALFDLCEWRPRFGRPVRAAYLAGALAFFVLRYPVWAGVTMPCQCFDGWHWKFWLQLFSWGKAPV
jgi:dolichyl-phosphate-mannose--protein O-mannosyl transferase